MKKILTILSLFLSQFLFSTNYLTIMSDDCSVKIKQINHNEFQIIFQSSQLIRLNSILLNNNNILDKIEINKCNICVNDSNTTIFLQFDKFKPEIIYKTIYYK